MKIGILSLQGDFEKHRMMFDLLGIDTVLVRERNQFSTIDGLVIPGGESTTMGKLIGAFNLDAPLKHEILEKKMPVLGTCAGMILLAKDITGYSQYTIGALDITVERNAYGRQTESFETDITAHFEKNETIEKKFKGVFIRAPRITGTGDEVEILARFEDSPVLVRQGNILAMSFHPELTDDTYLHSFFCEMVENVIGTYS